MLKKTDNFVWSDAANEAFEDLKRQLANPPILAAPVDKEPLLQYVAANARAVSVAIVVERKEAGKEYPVQRPVYYISEVTLNPSRGTRIGKNWCMGFSWQAGSLNIFSGSSYHSGRFSPFGRYHSKQRSNGPDCQMGY